MRVADAMIAPAVMLAVLLAQVPQQSDVRRPNDLTLAGAKAIIAEDLRVAGLTPTSCSEPVLSHLDGQAPTWFSSGDYTEPAIRGAVGHWRLWIDSETGCVNILETSAQGLQAKPLDPGVRRVVDSEEVIQRSVARLRRSLRLPTSYSVARVEWFPSRYQFGVDGHPIYTRTPMPPSASVACVTLKPVLPGGYPVDVWSGGPGCNIALDLVTGRVQEVRCLTRVRVTPRQVRISGFAARRIAEPLALAYIRRSIDADRDANGHLLGCTKVALEYVWPRGNTILPDGSVDGQPEPMRIPGHLQLAWVVQYAGTEVWIDPYTGEQVGCH